MRWKRADTYRHPLWLLCFCLGSASLTRTPGSSFWSCKPKWKLQKHPKHPKTHSEWSFMQEVDERLMGSRSIFYNPPFKLLLSSPLRHTVSFVCLMLLDSPDSAFTQSDPNLHICLMAGAGLFSVWLGLGKPHIQMNHNRFHIWEAAVIISWVISLESHLHILSYVQWPGDSGLDFISNLVFICQSKLGLKLDRETSSNYATHGLSFYCFR